MGGGKVADADLSLISPKQWYLRDGIGNKNKSLDRDLATKDVDELMKFSQVASSSNLAEVQEAAIVRRCL
jgi:hypothetical protein